jgi:hypothetical protein
MKFRFPLAVLLMALPAALAGQGVRMSADFLPLEVGNRWVYDIENESGQKIGNLEFSVQEHRIIAGRSFYVLTRFPFVSDYDGLIRLIRYDRQERQYLRMIDEEEGPLFLADGTTTEVTRADSAGLPTAFTLHMDTMALTFERGVGITEARIPGANGLQIAKMTAAHIGELPAGSPGGPSDSTSAPPPPPPATPNSRARELIENVTSISEDNPRIEIEAVPAGNGYKLTLTVTNISDKLLPFNFNTGQSYDFVVMDSQTKKEIWRWSRRMFFTSVIRSEAIAGGKAWRFDAEWNLLDDDQNPVTPGAYSLIGIITAQPPIETEPVPIDVK